MLRACIFLWAAISIAGLSKPDWGFFGHRLINNMAVFTLPPELISFYKQHVDYVTAHAVDPDKRRYATRHEGSRHYIDLDRWGNYPYESLPRNWINALAMHIEYRCVDSDRDTTLLKIDATSRMQNRTWVFRHILPQYYEDERSVDCDSLSAYFDNISCDDCDIVLVTEQLSSHGILPYHLVKAQRDLTEAFRQENVVRILALSADIGHYIADAHVPLHTTENYNGQLTGQKGIHAFWESRIPELFAEQYDFFTGRARYIEDPVDYYWSIVLHSNSLADSVLTIEKQLSREIPADRQYCFGERGVTMVRSECPEYAKAYSDAMQNMVERQMRAAAAAVGNAWFTAWIDAGQPQLRDSTLVDSEEARASLEKIERDYRNGIIMGRAHDNSP